MENSNISVRKMLERDIPSVAKLHEIVFPRQTFSMDWVQCTYRSFPMHQCFVAETDGKIVGFVFWAEKSGFRKEAFVELVQGGTDPVYQRQGICSTLVEQSMRMVADKIAERGALLKNIVVNTRADNHFALSIAKKVLNAQPVAVVPGVFTADEVYLVAHDVDRLLAPAKLAASCP